MQQYIKDAYLLFIKCPNGITISKDLGIKMTPSAHRVFGGTIQDRFVRFGDIITKIIVPYTTVKIEKSDGNLIDFTPEEINSILEKINE